MFLSFDVESTSLFDKNLPWWDESQPHLAQIGAVLADHDWREIGVLSTLIQPAGWHMSEGAYAVHGISIEDCFRYGVSVTIALAMFIEMVKKARYVIGHNVEFDRQIVELEIRRLGSDDLGLKRPRLRILDTMRIGTSGTEDGLFPSLAALYENLTGEALVGAHSGLTDARAAMRCACIMIGNRAIEL
jgi:DNA polymerase III epsilon subunit-like protein